MRKLFLIALVTLQTACTSYQYIEPQDELGKDRVRECLNKQWDCKSACHNSYSRCLAAPNINLSLFNSTTSQINPYEERSKICRDAQYDCERSCSNGYNSCFVSSGGVIIEK